ncbi:MAG: TerB family tellurite resistance protein [Pseudomonadota bacterium]
MHIIIALVTAIAGLLWAISRFSDAAQSGRDAIGDVRGLWRSGQWSRKVSQRLIENLEDPREAAAILMYQTAEYDGAVTERQIVRITGLMAKAFETDKETTDALYAFARMAVGQVTDAGGALRKLLEPIKDACSEEEKRDLIGILKEIAEVEGPANDHQKRFLADVERRLFPA